MRLSILGCCLLMATLFWGAAGHAAGGYYGQNLCGYPGFKCIEVGRGDTWSRLFPNRKDRELVKRLNRTNVALRYRSWILVPNNLRSLSYASLSPFNSRYDTNGKRMMVVNLSKQAFVVYDERGDYVHWGPISAGKGWCSDVGTCNTVTGKFKIYRKQGAGCKSSKYPLPDGGAPMPYCMHFHGGFAIHGSTLPGYHASHGCIRLFNDDAKWLNKHFMKMGTPVVVQH